MPACEGRPDGPCPNKRVDSSVHPSQGELMLCSACEIYRFPYLASTASDNSSVSRQVVKQDNCPMITPPATGTTDTPVDNKNVLVVCELLYFVGNTMDKHPLSTIKSVICEFYRDDEIVSAKQKLISVMPETAKGSYCSQFMKNRIGSNKIKASVDDIISIMSTIDENGQWSSLPTFCAASRCRVPDIPDEQSDIAAIRQELKTVRQQLDRLMSKFLPVEESKEELDEGRGCPSSPLIIDSHSPPQSKPVTAQSVADSVVTYAEAAERNREDVFRVVTRKKAPKKKQVVVGSSTNNTLFKGVAKKAVVCVNRLDPSVSTDVVTEFLKDNGVNVLSCYRVKNKQPTSELGDGDQPTAELSKEIRFISMRLCVSYSDLDKIFDTNLWPDGVVVRPWSFKNKANIDRQS